MPEAEKKALRLEQELTATKSKLQQIDEEKNKTLYDQARDQAYQEIDQEISGALKAMGKAPTPRMIARIAETMLASLSDETKPRIDGKRAVEETLSEFQKDLGEYLDSLEPEELMRVLPKKKLDALRRAQVDEVLSQSPIKSKKRETDEPQTQSKKQKNMTTDDYFKHLERRLG